MITKKRVLTTHNGFLIQFIFELQAHYNSSLLCCQGFSTRILKKHFTFELFKCYTLFVDLIREGKRCLMLLRVQSENVSAIIEKEPG